MARKKSATVAGVPQLGFGATLLVDDASRQRLVEAAGRQDAPRTAESDHNAQIAAHYESLEARRHECEVRYVAALPCDQQGRYLRLVAARRGAVAAERLAMDAVAGGVDSNWQQPPREEAVDVAEEVGGHGISEAEAREYELALRT